MQRIQHGELKILHSSDIYTFPSTPKESMDTTKDHRAELRVISPAFWIRLVAMSDLGFAEAYMYGEVECDDLIELFKVSQTLAQVNKTRLTDSLPKKQIFLHNRSSLVGLENSLTSYVFSLPQKLTSYRFLNNISNSRSNISAHYDISNEMFEAFLSKDMTVRSDVLFT